VVMVVVRLTGIHAAGICPPEPPAPVATTGPASPRGPPATDQRPDRCK
jgi:hypothetical protein